MADDLRTEDEDNEYPEAMEVDLDWIDKVDSLFRMPNFGVGATHLKAAGAMIAKDMWLAGDVTIEELSEDFDGDEDSPVLFAALKDMREELVEKLRLSAERGNLKTVLTIRDFDDNIDPGRTYVDEHELLRWLRERGYSAGHYVERWMEDEEKISHKLCEESLFLRTSNNDPRFLSFSTHRRVESDESDIETLRAAYKSVLIEMQILKEKFEYVSRQPQKPEGEMNPKARNTLLVMIGALCGELNVSLESGKFAPRMKEVLERSGIKADPGPFRRMPPDILEALARRKN